MLYFALDAGCFQKIDNVSPALGSGRANFTMNTIGAVRGFQYAVSNAHGCNGLQIIGCSSGQSSAKSKKMWPIALLAKMADPG
jgi:hypothetical protein